MDGGPVVADRPGVDLADPEGENAGKDAVARRGRRMWPIDKFLAWLDPYDCY